MKKTQKDIMDFTVVFQPDTEGIYHVIVPALPGCFTFGHNLEEAQEKAKELIELWLEEMADEKKSFPVNMTIRPWIGEIQVQMPRFQN